MGLCFFISHSVFPFGKNFKKKKSMFLAWSYLVVVAKGPSLNQALVVLSFEAAAIQFSHPCRDAVQRNWGRHNWDGGWRGKEQRSIEGQGQYIRKATFCISLELRNFIDFQKRFVQVKLASSLAYRRVLYVFRLLSSFDSAAGFWFGFFLLQVERHLESIGGLYFSTSVSCCKVLPMFFRSYSLSCIY